MKRTALIRLAAFLIAVAAIVIVAVVAYQVGVNHSSSAPLMRGMPFRGRAVGWVADPGLGLFWVIGLVAIGLLFVWLLAALLSSGRGGAVSTAPAAADVEKLHELAAMHDAGKLTDEEFTAAKRSLLGLQ